MNQKNKTSFTGNYLIYTYEINVNEMSLMRMTDEEKK